MESGYSYESTFVEMMRKVSQEVFQSSVGKVPKSKNSKKSTNHSRENRNVEQSCTGLKP